MRELGRRPGGRRSRWIDRKVSSSGYREWDGVCLGTDNVFVVSAIDTNDIHYSWITHHAFTHSY